MQAPTYSEKKIRKAIKCYYLNKASTLGAFFHNEEYARKIIDNYVNGCIIPEDILSINFICIVLCDLDADLYDTNSRDKKDRLVQLHKKHFDIEHINQLANTHSRFLSVAKRNESLDID